MAHLTNAQIREIEAEEAKFLTPATARIRAEREQIEAQNRALASVVTRKEQLVARLQTALDEAEVERRELAMAVERILVPSP